MGISPAILPWRITRIRSLIPINSGISEETMMMTFGVTYIGMLHDYHFILEDVQAKNILEEYTYEWTDEEI